MLIHERKEYSEALCVYIRERQYATSAIQRKKDMYTMKYDNGNMTGDDEAFSSLAVYALTGVGLRQGT